MENSGRSSNEKKRIKELKRADSSSLRCWYTNATFLNNKFDIFKTELAHQDYLDLVFVTETWFKETSLMHMYQYDLYKVTRDSNLSDSDERIETNKKEERRRIGYIYKKKLTSYEVTEKCFSSEKCEQIWCEIKLKSEKVLIGCIYRPHKSSDKVDRAINKAIRTAKALVTKKKYTAMLVVGDFNHPDIEWSESIGQLNSNDKSAQVLLSNLNSNYISQLVNEPTFSNNFLDLILTDDSCRVSEVSIGPPLGVSEKNSFHSTITWKFAMQDKSLDNRVITKRNYQMGDYLRMSAHLSNIDWNEMFTSSNVDICYVRFLKIYDSALEEYIPLKKINTNLTGLEWKLRNDPEVKTSRENKFTIFARMRASPRTAQLKKEYREAANSLRRSVWNAQLEFKRSITEKCKAQPNFLYAYINSQNNFKQQIRVLTSKQGEEVSDPVGIANCLTDNFYEIFTKGARVTPLPYFPMRTEKECKPRDDFLSEIYVLEQSFPTRVPRNPWVRRRQEIPKKLLILLLKNSFVFPSKITFFKIGFLDPKFF